MQLRKIVNAAEGGLGRLRSCGMHDPTRRSHDMRDADATECVPSCQFSTYVLLRRSRPLGRLNEAPLVYQKTPWIARRFFTSRFQTRFSTSCAPNAPVPCPSVWVEARNGTTRAQDVLFTYGNTLCPSFMPHRLSACRGTTCVQVTRSQTDCQRSSRMRVTAPSPLFTSSMPSDAPA